MHDDTPSGASIGYMIFGIICLILGFAAGYSLSRYQYPDITKARELEIMEKTIDSMTAVAKARAITMLSCGRCHE